MFDVENWIMELVDEKLKDQGFPGAEYLIKAKIYVEKLFPKKNDRRVFLMSMLETIWEMDGISFDEAVEDWRKRGAGNEHV